MSAQLLVQLNIPEKLLNPTAVPVPLKECEEQLKRICMALLPRLSAPVLIQEPKNSATRLLIAVTYFKVKRRFFNEGTQAEVVEKFNINTKTLSKLLTGCQYLGTSEQKKKQTTIIQEEKGKLVLLRKRKSIPSKVVVKKPDNDNDEEKMKVNAHQRNTEVTCPASSDLASTPEEVTS